MTSRIAWIVCLGWLTAFPAAADEAGWPDWSAHADVGVIDVVTRDPDGDVRDVPVWFVEVDGSIYLRTRDSRWLANLRRDPNLLVRIEGVEYPLRAVEVAGAEIVAAVDAATAEKYGWQERLIHVFRTGTPQILRLEPRGAAAAPGGQSRKNSTSSSSRAFASR